MPANLTVDRSSLTHNLSSISSSLHPKIMAVVKSNAYGHGIVGISQTIEKFVTSFAVVDLKEASILRSFTSKPILLLAPLFSHEELNTALEMNIDITISNHESLNALTTFKKSHLLKTHIKVDTGMNRLGFKASEVNTDLLNTLKKHSKLTGLYTHFPAPEDEEFTHQQIKTFNRIVRIAREVSPTIVIHAANSMTSLRYPESHYDMIRIGFLMYGVPPSVNWRRDFEKLKLKRVATFSAKVIEVKKLSRGEGTSYDLLWKAPIDAKIAVIDAGYADGIPRSLSNRGWVFLNSRFCKIVGNVCMDYTCVLVPPEHEVKVGDTAEIWGKNNPLEEVAAAAGTIPYEMMTSISEKTERVFA